MKIKLICAGKTNEPYLSEGIAAYVKRLGHYIPFELIELPEIKAAGKTNEKLKEEESKAFLAKISNTDYLILLDENGKSLTSVGFSNFLQNKMNRSVQSLVFLAGGPFGFSKELYARSNEKIALSPMTFSHQMVRLFFVEQLYRGFTILKGEKYHHN